MPTLMHMLFPCCILLLLAVLHVQCNDYWQPSTTMTLPFSPRTSMSISNTDSHILVVGGSVDTEVVNDVYLYSVSTSTWQHLPSPPFVPLTSASLCPIGTGFILMGGYVKNSSDSALSPSNVVYFFDIPTTTWSTLSPLTTPFTPRHLTSCSTDNATSAVYLLGGAGDGNELYNDIYRYDHTSAWSTLPVPPWSPRSSLCSLIYSHSLLVMGGFSGNQYMGDMWMGDMRTNVWTLLSYTLSPRSLFTTSIFMHRHLYIAGGLYDGAHAYNDVIHIYLPDEKSVKPENIVSNVTTSIAPWSPRSQLRLISLPTTLYILGGVDEEVHNMNDVWEWMVLYVPASISDLSVNVGRLGRVSVNVTISFTPPTPTPPHPLTYYNLTDSYLTYIISNCNSYVITIEYDMNYVISVSACNGVGCSSPVHSSSVYIPTPHSSSSSSTSSHHPYVSSTGLNSDEQSGDSLFATAYWFIILMVFTSIALITLLIYCCYKRYAARKQTERWLRESERRRANRNRRKRREGNNSSRNGDGEDEDEDEIDDRILLNNSRIKYNDRYIWKEFGINDMGMEREQKEVEEGEMVELMQRMGGSEREYSNSKSGSVKRVSKLDTLFVSEEESVERERMSREMEERSEEASFMDGDEYVEQEERNLSASTNAHHHHDQHHMPLIEEDEEEEEEEMEDMRGGEENESDDEMHSPRSVHPTPTPTSFQRTLSDPLSRSSSAHTPTPPPPPSLTSGGRQISDTMIVQYAQQFASSVLSSLPISSTIPPPHRQSYITSISDALYTSTLMSQLYGNSQLLSQLHEDMMSVIHQELIVNASPATIASSLFHTLRPYCTSWLATYVGSPTYTTTTATSSVVGGDVGRSGSRPASASANTQDDTLISSRGTQPELPSASFSTTPPITVHTLPISTPLPIRDHDYERRREERRRMERLPNMLDGIMTVSSSSSSSPPSSSLIINLRRTPTPPTLSRSTSANGTTNRAPNIVDGMYTPGGSNRHIERDVLDGLPGTPTPQSFHVPIPSITITSTLSNEEEKYMDEFPDQPAPDYL